MFAFFISYSLKDILRKKTMYFVAFLAVFISILSILLIDVVVKKGSLIFVKMSEELEIDAQISPHLKMAEQGEYTDFHINYTRVAEL